MGRELERVHESHGLGAWLAFFDRYDMLFSIIY